MPRFLLVACLLAGSFAAPAQQANHNHAMHGAAMGVAAQPTEPGQGAFAAIQEIVDLLIADPKTDWSKVDIDGLRRHLVDMSNVTLHAKATASPVANGVRFTVTGAGPVRESIQRMIPAHAMVMDGKNGMSLVAGSHPDGATLTVTAAAPADQVRLKALGFFGVMAMGMHHQAHHLALASGMNPHHH